jgi:hypothetical protein
MSPGILSTPRPVPNRLTPIAASAAVLVLALPIFLVAGWRLAGWALAAVLWLAGQGLGLLLVRLRIGLGNLAASGVLAFGMMFRAIAVMVVLVVVAVSDAKLALAAALVYALAYTFELGVSVVTYFAGEPQR